MPKPAIEQAFPHIRRGTDTLTIMAEVELALLPACCAAVWYFGLRALWLLLLTIAVCVLTEELCLLLRRQAGFDGSAMVTGTLLALSLPAGTPFWAVALAGVFAIAVVKQLFGGIGRNLLNPAMAGRALLMLAFPQTLGGYALNGLLIDSVTSATPLSGAREPLVHLLTGERAGSMGETATVLLLLGGAFLYVRGWIRLRVPVTCLWSFALFVWIFGGKTSSGGLSFFTGDAASQLLSGGLMLAAFFILTDFTTKPTTPVGELVFAGGVGILTAVLRLWGPWPEGVCFAVLLMNLAAPLLETLTRRTVYGVKKSMDAHHTRGRVSQSPVREGSRLS